MLKTILTFLAVWIILSAFAVFYLFRMQASQGTHVPNNEELINSYKAYKNRKTLAAKKEVEKTPPEKRAQIKTSDIKKLKKRN